MNKVPVQKGPINAATRTSKTMSEVETYMQDRRAGEMRRDGQILKFHTPKQ